MQPLFFALLYCRELTSNLAVKPSLSVALPLQRRPELFQGCSIFRLGFLRMQTTVSTVHALSDCAATVSAPVSMTIPLREKM